MVYRVCVTVDFCRKIKFQLNLISALPPRKSVVHKTFYDVQLHKVRTSCKKKMCSYMTLTASRNSREPLLKAGTSTQNDVHKAKNNCFCQREVTAATASKKS